MFKTVYLSVTEALRQEIEGFIRQWESPSTFISAHTSGSTGKPKEIRLPKADMRTSARATNTRFAIGPTSRLLCPLSPSYIAGKMMIVRAMEADCEIAFCNPANDFWENPYVAGYAAGGDIDLIPVVPSQCTTLLRSTLSPNTEASLSPLALQLSTIRHLRNIIVGGAPISPQTEATLPSLSSRLSALDPRPSTVTAPQWFATYGMTETCSHVALRPLGQTGFTAMPGITFGTDSRGCLEIFAPAYSFGHLQTNDIITLIDDHRFIWRGRHDNVINSGGIKIFPEELERKLAGHLPFRFYFKSTPDPKWGEAVTLVTETEGNNNTHNDKNGNNNLSDSEIFAVCRRVLLPHEQPKLILHIPNFPQTASGKLIRRYM